MKGGLVGAGEEMRREKVGEIKRRKVGEVMVNEGW